MNKEKSNSKLSLSFQELFVLSEIQSIQDAFAKATGVASIITKPDGKPITKPSNFCRLCSEIIRKTDTGLSNCINSDAFIGRYNPHGPIIQPCLSGGLWEAGASISVDGKHIANWLIGQVRNDKVNENLILEYAKKIGADEKEFRTALYEVTVMSSEQFEQVSQTLFLIANQLSQLAFQKIQKEQIISKQQKTERALLRSETKYREIYKNILDVYYETSFEGIILEISPSVEKHSQYKREDLIGKSLYDIFINPSDRDKLIEIIINKGSVRDYEITLTDKDGSLHICSLNVDLIKDEKSNSAKLVGIFRVTTERIQAEEKLRQSEEKFRIAFQTSPNAITLTSVEDGTYIDINEGFTKILGYSQEDVIGKSAVALNIWNNSKDREILISGLKKNGLVENLEAEFKGKNGQIIDGLMTARILDIENKKYLLAVTQDITEKKVTEQAMRLIQYGVDSASDCIFWMDSECRFVYVNDAACNSLGYSFEELLSMDLTQIDPKVSLDAWQDQLSKLKRIKSNRFESQHLTKDGRLVPVEITSSYILFEGEEGVFSFVRDITERKQAEMALKKSEERYRLIAENAADVIWSTDMSFTFTYISPSVYQQRGYTVEEALKQSADKAMLPDSLEKIMILFAEKMDFIESGDSEGWEPVEFEIEQYHKNGGIIWTGNNARILPGPDGKPISILGITRDITDRKQMEEKLKDIAGLNQKFFLESPIGISIYDESGQCIEANDSIGKIIGATKEQVLKQNYNEIESWKKSGLLNTAKNAIKDGTSKHQELQLTTTFGEKLCVDYYFVPFLQKSKTKLMFMVTDITERKKVEDKNEKLKEQLNQTQRMEAIGTLAGGIAHDFNNILSGIFGYSQLAKMNITDPSKVSKNIDQVIKGAHKATDLVKQILTFSRKSDHEMQPLKIFMEVKEAVKLLRSSIPSTIEIKENITSKATVLADLTQIHQVVMNLCTNAYHAMRKKGGILTVGLNETEVSNTNNIPDLNITPGTYLKLEVSDTGSGIKPEILDKIFEPYFTTKEIGKGTGLGLAVVLGIIEEHNGYIKVYSEPGEGATFHVYFPVIKDQFDSNSQAEEKNIIPGGTERIMIVDDEISILTSMQGHLEYYGYTVITFSDSEHALKEFEKDPSQFDLIITDMTMPKMTGKDLSHQILKIRDDLPIILCTGYSESFTEDKALKFGIKKYMQKPIDFQDFLTLIREVLDEK
ncbi:MAG: PAS domain S-box protein [Desulfobacteraceae bacterium]|nr:PAS domain S-box protein [Desulfobacteraceae bacterium]